MAEETKTEVAQTQEGTVTTPQSEAPNLTVADLRNIRAIIDISSQRGAFRGAELKTVGEVFDKLDAFLKAVDAKAQAEAPKEGDAPAEANTEEK